MVPGMDEENMVSGAFWGAPVIGTMRISEVKFGGLSTTKPRIPVSIDELITFMALCPVHAAAKSGERRWEITYQTAVWAIWKAYLSHSFDQPHNYWTPEPVWRSIGN